MRISRGSRRPGGSDGITARSASDGVVRFANEFGRRRLRSGLCYLNHSLTPNTSFNSVNDNICAASPSTRP